ncbi:DNA-binding domain of Mlu1-box binding protein MBP1 [Rickenella mellea]|uniref:DNA-binding domain of Mlu1-box binding protein MBP1 n=1 Tax=Rickenella mellea TaxID=50990 RepID=A0A4Y7QDS8_9AGAM|nr:DNA-binding domain of Mlu1-box binding protein MBP1 [Rickenella mellea]
MDSAGLLQDSMPSPPTETATGAARFRPYASTSHQVTKGRYITSNDPRGYIPVYEYPLNGQWIMMDIDDGYILWTGIWKALGNAKADIVRMLESQPDLAPQLRRVRGGYLKIQGTWMPYEIALRLARRVAWPIREDLIPLFGPTFPSTCLSPDQPGYGQVVTNTSGRRRVRRNVLSTSSTKVHPRPQQSRSQPAKPGASVSPETPVQRSHLESFAPQRHEQHAESSKHPHLFQGAYSPQDPNSSFAERMRRSPPKPLNIPNLSTSASDFADTHAGGPFSPSDTGVQ